VEQLVGTGASHEQAKAAGCGHPDEQDHKPVKPGGGYPGRQALSGAPGALETGERNQQPAADRKPGMERRRDCGQPSATSAFWTRPTIRTSQKMPIARKAHPRFRRLKAEAAGVMNFSLPLLGP
jgi:hypothetical protein